MIPMAKAFIVINLVLSVVFLGMAAALLATGDEYRKRYDEEVRKHEQTKKDMQDRIGELLTDVDTKKSELSQAQSRFINEEVKSKDLRSELEQEKAASKELRNSFDSLENNYKDLTGQLKDYKDRVSDLEEKRRVAEERAREAMSKQDAAEADVARLESELADARDQIEGFEKSVQDLGEKLEKSERMIEWAKSKNFDFGKILAPTAVDGKVLRVDHGLGIVMLSVGRDDGVEKGYTFDVYRGKDYVGQIIVDEVMADFSSAIIKKTKIPIQELDEVTTRL